MARDSQRQHLDSAAALAASLESVGDTESEQAVESLLRRNPGEIAYLLRYAYVDRDQGVLLEPAQARKNIPKMLGRLYDRGRLSNAVLHEILNPINTVPPGTTLFSDPRPLARVLSDSGSNRLFEDATQSLLGTAGAIHPDAARYYYSAAVQLGPAAMLRAFERQEELIDRFFRFAPPSTQARLVQKLNEHQQQYRLSPLPSIHIDTLPTEELELMDTVYTRARKQKEPTDALEVALSVYVNQNANRSSFLESVMLEALRKGRRNQPFRTQLRKLFSALGPDECRTVLEIVREQNLLAPLMDACLRNARGLNIDPVLRKAAIRMFETGRVDLFVGALASLGLVVHDPENSGLPADHHYSPEDEAIYFNDTDPRFAKEDVEDLARVLAVESFKAYARPRGLSDCALADGLGIAVVSYAFTDSEYNVAEMVYGTKNFFRDLLPPNDTPYPLGELTFAELELTGWLRLVMERDSSGLAWDDPARFEADFEQFWRPLDRGAHDWGQAAHDATVEMIDARGTLPDPNAPLPMNKIE